MKNIISIILVAIFSIGCSGNIQENNDTKKASVLDIKLNIGKPIYKVIDQSITPEVSPLTNGRKKYVITRKQEAFDELPPICTDFDGFPSCIPSFGINGSIDKEIYIVDSKGIIQEAKTSYEIIPYKPYVEPSALEKVLPACIRENMLKIPCEVR